MDIILYIIIFIVGAFLGSLQATIIKRMSKGKKIFSLHSYCGECGKKLSFIEKVPILSYIFFRGKCRHCKEKIDKKYIVLEILVGALLLFTAYTLNILDSSVTKLISFIFIILYFTYIILTAGADYEKKKMPSTLLAFGVLISIAYIIYLLFEKNITLQVGTIYLAIIVFLLILNIINTKKRAQSSYTIDLLTLLLVMVVFTGEIICILTISGTLLSIGIYILINNIKSKENKVKNNKTYSGNVKTVFLMTVLNIFIFLLFISIK